MGRRSTTHRDVLQDAQFEAQRDAAGSPEGFNLAPLIQSRRTWYSGEVLASKRTPPAWAFLVGSLCASASSAASHVGLPTRRLSAGLGKFTTRSAARKLARTACGDHLPSLPGGTILRIVCDRWQPMQFCPSSPIALKTGSIFASK